MLKQPWIYTICLTFVQVIFWINLSAQSAPVLLCNSVSANGDVTITWSAPSISDPCFSGYQIFSGDALKGTYTSVAVIPSSTQTSYVHSSTTANDKRLYYYVKATSSCGSGFISDTLVTVLLNLNRNGVVADLIWNSPDPVNPGTYTYSIQREFPLNSGNWTSIGSSSVPKFSDTIIYCSTPRYKIEISQGNCTIASSIEAGFNDITGPGVTEIATVTVDSSSGKALITWPVNPARDTRGYFVLSYKGPSADPTTLDTVLGRTTLSYLDTQSKPDQGSDAYLLMPFDSCGNWTRVGFFEHHTIFVSGKADVCSANITLTWNKYLNWLGGVKNYEVYANSKLIATLDNNTTSYKHMGLNQSTPYAYFIRAIPVLSSLEPSVSNKINITTGAMAAPKFVDIKKVTVTSNNRVLITCKVDSLADVSGYRLLRSNSLVGGYITISESKNTASGTINFDDASAQTQERTHFYMVEVMDSCGNSALLSAPAQTIFLVTEAAPEYINKIAWNAYSTEDSLYMIYRSRDGIWDLLPLKITDAGFTFEDDVSSFLEGEGVFCYKVQVLTKAADNTQTSLSNEFCVKQSPRLFIPNAFTPDGANPIFYPVNVFAKPETYLFRIFNRWGNIVFETQNPNLGWNGTHNGISSPGGVYVYHVKFEGTNGKNLEKTGSITLIR